MLQPLSFPLYIIIRPPRLFQGAGVQIGRKWDKNLMINSASVLVQTPDVFPSFVTRRTTHGSHGSWKPRGIRLNRFHYLFLRSKEITDDALR